MPFCAYIDVSGIQDFVFRSALLADNAAASAYIDGLGRKDDGLFWKVGGVHCIMAAAGNAVFRAETADELKSAIANVTKEMIKDGTGLSAVASLVEHKTGGLADGCRRALWEIERQKLIQPRSVTVSLPGLHRAPWHGRKAADDHHPSGLKRPRDLDRMLCAGSEQSSLIAVVSVDGIGMGNKAIKWLRKAMERQAAGNFDDDAFEEEYGRWSEMLKARWQGAWERVEDDIAEVFSETFPGEPQHRSDRSADPNRALIHPMGFKPLRWIALQSKGGDTYLPCRKIYQGGDDLTFVCDARIALSLTARLLGHIAIEPPDCQEVFRTLRCSAGILFCSSTFPFVRAIELAEKVRQTAKKAALERNSEDPPSTIDWWMNRQGDMARPESVRVRDSGSLTSMKPYHLDTSREDTPSWRYVEETWLGADDGLWRTFAQQHNKWKDIVAAAERGERDLRLLLAMRPAKYHQPPDKSCLGALGKRFLVSGHPKDSLEPHPGDGFTEAGQTPLIDLGEIFDLHFPLGAAGDLEATP